MKQDVYIAYDEKDFLIRDLVCEKLEADGIKCRFVPRDMLSGETREEAAKRVISSCSAMILILTENSNRSTTILEEIKTAKKDGISILTLPLLNFNEISGILQFELGNIQLYNAVNQPEQPLETTIENFCADVRIKISRNTETEKMDKPESEKTDHELTNDIFIGYIDEDSAIMERIRRELSVRNMGCTTEVNDIGLLNRKLLQSKLAIMILTERSMQSDRMLNLMRTAFDNRIPIVPFLLWDGEINPALMYYLINYRCISGFEQSVKPVVDYVKGIINQFNNFSKPGTIVTFGFYPQDANSDVKVPIEWIVLDSIGKKSLLISRYSLANRPFNDIDRKVDWQSSTMRSWLNHEFSGDAFNIDELGAILSVDPRCQDHVGEGDAATDKIFLLSSEEAMHYFPNEQDRMCAPTEYAIREGTNTYDDFQADGKPAGDWWLRSQGKSENLADADKVLACGKIDHGFVNGKLTAVRPAIWFNLEKVTAAFDSSGNKDER